MSGGVHLVAVLVREGVLPMELGIVHQLFGQARSAEGAPLYEVVSCGVEPGTVRADADFAVAVEHGLEALEAADTVVVPASHVLDESRPGEGPAPGALAAAAGRGARVASVCTGAFVLAAAGLLEGRRATTHWLSCARLAEMFPGVRVDAAVLFVDEGAVLTSAGEAAGIDLCLHMIRCDHGAAVAGDVARRTVVPPHREGGQAQFTALPVPPARASSTGAARAWALERLERPVTLAQLAARASMSVRTFTRRFRQETGVSPQVWLTAQRVQAARRLLEETDLPVDRVAERAGFGTAASLRRHLHAAIGVSPSSYRTTFRGAGGA
ncbi:GlxA family transcriptional regulator [Actinomadura citrea]|uniref:Transcriptional regulator GlxA family with amidase domain n=1 Tax=Actinomadura citrea TaxID=46158 RepID=A0A7Y9GCL7_9ACTN|nr:helix-turn-helix domain-containing protein [Actinomadura citrea]NYE13916.1 transcriptional regulator GlxA family with amidase domain [Actinomadura citrea]GGT98221.1 AraC family transcriptional regulator [Actinomadura citrea]